MCRGGLPQSCVQQIGVSHDIENALNSIQAFLQHDTLMWVGLSQGQILLSC